MFGAAMGVLGGGSSSGFNGGGLSGAAMSMQQLVADRQATMNSYTNPAAAVAGVAVLVRWARRVSALLRWRVVERYWRQ